MGIYPVQHLVTEEPKSWNFHNPNPKGKHIGDCTVRAISKALGKDWDSTFMSLAIQGFLMADMPSSNAVTTAYLKGCGFKRKTIPESCEDCYCINDFCRDHPSGTYIIGTGSHLTTVIDGELWDSWDSRNETPVYYFEKMED